jgi:hypothetical protein
MVDRQFQVTPVEPSSDGSFAAANHRTGQRARRTTDEPCFTPVSAGTAANNPIRPFELENRMPTKSKSHAPTSKRKKTTRCWPGYEPTPGKKAYSKGSCRKK